MENCPHDGNPGLLFNAIDVTEGRLSEVIRVIYAYSSEKNDEAVRRMCTDTIIIRSHKKWTNTERSVQIS